MEQAKYPFVLDERIIRIDSPYILEGGLKSENPNLDKTFSLPLRTIVSMAAYSINDFRCLIQLRSSISRWGEVATFFGGGVKLSSGETPLQAMDREGREELNRGGLLRGGFVPYEPGRAYRPLGVITSVLTESALPSGESRKDLEKLMAAGLQGDTEGFEIYLNPYAPKEKALQEDHELSGRKKVVGKQWLNECFVVAARYTQLQYDPLISEEGDGYALMKLNQILKIAQPSPVLDGRTLMVHPRDIWIGYMLNNFLKAEEGVNALDS